MKAVVFHAIDDIRLDGVPERRIEQPSDAIVRLTASAICYTGFHLVRGPFSGMEPGTILDREGVGIVEKVGAMTPNQPTFVRTRSMPPVQETRHDIERPCPAGRDPGRAHDQRRAPAARGGALDDAPRPSAP
jgi:threonine dehydrogenase-like Zn-dependent dehydrogenase